MNAAALASLLLVPLQAAEEIEAARRAIDAWSERYAIHRPWAEPDVPEPARFCRGALAHVVARLNSAPEDVRLLVCRDLGRLLAHDASTDPGRTAIRDSRAGHADAYGRLFDIDLFPLWKQLIIPGAVPEPPWGRRTKEVYYSRADGGGESFELQMPPRIEGRERYPLLVVLKGGPSVAPSRQHPFIQVVPSGRGVWGPCSLSGWDAMQVVEHMKRRYPVDPDRVYITGFSAGASATMHLAARRADEFAAALPLVAFGTGVPLFNLKNLPVAIHHGTEDWTSSVCNVRVQAQLLERLRYPAEYVEYRGAGHSVPGPHAPLADWLLKQVRNPCPDAVALECETSGLGRSFWISILEFADPHAPARIEASLGPDGLVRIAPRNVGRFAVDLALLREKRGFRARAVEIDGRRLDVDEGAQREGVWTWGGPAAAAGRPYQAGAAANLYQGEPLLIVAGTGAPEARRRGLLMSLANKLARYGGPPYAALRSRFPVVADVDLGAEQEANCNLILVGAPEENRVSRAILPDLPIRIREGILDVEGRPSLALRDRVLSLLARHPKHPDRLVYLLAPFTDEAGLALFEGGAPQHALIGADGFDRLSQPDLAVQTLDREIGRQMQYGKDWLWIRPPGDRRPLPPRFRDRAELALAIAGLMRRGSGADAALWWGPADKGMWSFDFNFLKRYDPETFTEADLRAQRGSIETMIGGVSGRELKEIWTRWGENRELLFSSDLDLRALDDDRRLRLQIPMDLYIKLGNRKKALDAPEAGPPIPWEDVRKELFP